jgi:hypothetical protein
VCAERAREAGLQSWLTGLAASMRPIRSHFEASMDVRSLRQGTARDARVHLHNSAAGSGERLVDRHEK